MKKLMQRLFHIVILFLCLTIHLVGQSVSPNCTTVSTENQLTGEVFFNFGTITNSFNTENRSSYTIGQPIIGSNFGQDFLTGSGFWSRFLLPPSEPIVTATEGDLEDRVQVTWASDPLSPNATLGYKIYRDGALLASVDGNTNSFVDFNVIAGIYYNYTVSGVNDFGEGPQGPALGFLNPNGVVTGQVKSFSGNPVPGAIVTLNPTLGNALSFDGVESMALQIIDLNFLPNEFTFSCWTKLRDGNDHSGIVDFGSHIGKNWWLKTLPQGSGKGVRFGLGENLSSTTELDYIFPVETQDDWHHIAATYNGTSLLLYIDGNLIEAVTADVTHDSIPLFIGRNSAGTSFFNGLLDEVRIINRQVSQTELLTFMNRSIPTNLDGLVPYWKFDEGVGNKAFDQSPLKSTIYFCGNEWTTDRPDVINSGVSDETGFYEIAGVNYGAGATFTATPSKFFHFNQSLEFNAANEEHANLTDFDLPDTSTLTLTVKAFEFDRGVLLSKRKANGDNWLRLKMNDGNLQLIIGNKSKEFGALPMGFHHISMVMIQNQLNLNMDLYIDGVLDGSHTFTNTKIDSTGYPWKIGAAYNNNHVNHFTGLIDEVACYDKALELSEIQSASNVGTDISHPSLLHYFNLNEGSGTELKDLGTGLSGSGETKGAKWSTSAAIEEVLAHEFSPPSRLVTLNPSSTSVDQVDFNDQSTIPVSGFVRYDKTSCFKRGVEILVNGESYTPRIFTDADGKFIADFEPGASVRLTPVFENHTFYPAFWDLNSLNAPVAGILFRDQTTRTVSGQLSGGLCNLSIIPNGAIVKVKVATLNTCYEVVKTIPAGNGKFEFNNVPADSVTVALIEHSALSAWVGTGVSTISDLKLENDTIDFTYIAPPQVELSALDTNSCGQPMLTMLNEYDIEVKVYEEYLPGGRCYLDTAELTFDNAIADLSQFDTIMTEGSFDYTFKAGGPNITSPYTKNLQVTANSLGQQATSSLSAVVLGRRPRSTEFVSTSPQFPMMILRDPPGDGSSSFIEEGSTTCQTWGFEASSTDNFGGGVTISLGPDVTTSLGLGAEVEFEIDVTADISLAFNTTVSNLASNEMETCITTTRKISTSDSEELIGDKGDVFLGGAFIMIFGITDELLYDTMNCGYLLDQGLVVFPDKFKTNYVYTENAIRTVQIPNALTAQDTASANQWQSILDRNDALKSKAVFSKNISFSGGVVYEESETTDVTESTSYNWTQEFSSEFATEFGISINGVGILGGLNMSFTTSESQSVTNSENTSTSVGYNLIDDDIGDVFTVDIKKDPAFGTPVFELISGRSQCPHEENTLFRQELNFFSDINVASNVSMNDEAVFNLSLNNISQSEEDQTYRIEAVQSSNPLGAVIKFNGVDGPLDLEIPYLEV